MQRAVGNDDEAIDRRGERPQRRAEERFVQARRRGRFRAGVPGFFDTGGVGAGGSAINFTRAVDNIPGGPHFKWRFRFRSTSPLFPRSRWVALTGNGPQEADLRGSCTAVTWHRDLDGDGFGNAVGTYVSCSQPAGYVAATGDCNDENRSIHPGAAEFCDGIDNDCDGTPDDGFSTPTAATGLVLSKTSPTIVLLLWDTLPDALAYDVTKGDLGTLQATGGDFTAATSACLADDRTSIGDLKDLAVPPAASGFWYLVRGVGCTADGTYNSGARSQVGSRDAEVEAAPAACP